MSIDCFDAMRSAERQKYLELRDRMPSYGSSNHGKAYHQTVVSWGRGPVIDLGCGGNEFVNNLRYAGIEATGVDFANEHADIVAPMHAIPVEDGSFGAVTAFDSLEHLLTEDVPLVFREIARVCQPGSPFIFTIAFRASNILAADGSNLHPTVRPRAWWAEQIGAIGTVKSEGRTLAGVLHG